MDIGSVIRIASLNIRSGQVGELGVALQVL